jgi:hypothetical protein
VHIIAEFTIMTFAAYLYHQLQFTAIKVKNPAAETAGRLKIEYSFSVSFPQAKRVGNPSDTLSK